jgi:exodeoxyribonuclease III
MRIATWNINSVRARREHVERWLRLRQPDVLLLQETKTKDSEFPPETFESLGFQTARAGQPSYNGVAILSRFPISDVKVGLLSGDDPNERRVLRAWVHPPTAPPLRVCSVYVPNGKTLDSPFYEAKLRFLAALADTLMDDGELDSLVLGGDFNVARDARDVFDPKLMENQIHFTPRERASLEKLLALGLADTLREKTQEPKLFSWWDYRMQAFRRNRGLRIDYVLAGQKILKGLDAAHIDREPRAWDTPSDHTPMVIDFRWEEHSGLPSDAP